MTLTLSNTKAAKAAPAPRPRSSAKAKPVVDADRLRRLAARIEEMKDTRLEELVDELTAQEDMAIADKGPHLGIEVRLAGLKSGATSGRRMALVNWAMAARRALLKLDA